MKETIEKIVYFVRHCESVANITPVYQPLGSPLSDKGRQQAKLIAERIAKLSFEALVVSPLFRAKETAEAITKLTGKKPEYSDLFVERTKPTRIIGKSHSDNEAVQLWKKWQNSLFIPGLRVEDGENFDDLIIRADKALDFLKNKVENSIVVVTHGFFLRTIIARVILGDSLTPEAFKNFHMRVGTENTGLSVLKYSKTWETTSWLLWIFNDHAHLG